MTGFPWCKLWNEAPDDPKFIAAADLAGSTPGNAFYAFCKSMSYANANEDRGSIAGMHPQVIASFCRIALDEAKRILDAFRELRMIIGNRLVNWTKRQTEAKPRSKNAERIDKCRRNKTDAARQGHLPFEPRQPVRQPDAVSVSGISSGISPSPEDSPQPFETQDENGPLLESESDSSEAYASERAPEVAPAPKRTSSRKEKPHGRTERKSRVAPDWEPDDQDCRYAESKGFYDPSWIAGQAERFRDHHLKTGSRFDDWHAAWRTWVQRADDFACRNGSARPGGDRTGPGTIFAAFRRLQAYGTTG